MTRELRFLLVFLLSTCFVQNGYGAVFDELSVQDQVMLVYKVSGSQNNILGIPKGVLDIKQSLKGRLSRLSNLNLSTMATTLINSKVTDLSGYADQMSSFSQVFEFTNRVAGLANTINQSMVPIAVKTPLLDIFNWQTILFDSVDLSGYVPNLNDIKAFWSKIESQYLASATTSVWYNNFTSQYNKSQLSNAALSAEIPTNDKGRQLLARRFDRLYHKNPLIVAKIFDIVSIPGTKLPSALLNDLDVIGKQLACHLLKKVDFMDYYTNYMFANDSRIELFDRMTKCSYKFVFDAVNANRMGLINAFPENLKDLLAQRMIEYNLMLGVNDSKIILDSLDTLILNLPPHALRNLFENIQNSSYIRVLFMRYNLVQNFYTFDKKFRVIVAKFASRYLNDTANAGRTWDAQDGDIFKNTLFDMKIEDMLLHMERNQNYQLVFQKTDNISSSWWLDNCNLARIYYRFLVRMRKRYNDSSITLNRLKPMLICKTDCIIAELYEGKSDSETSEIVKQVITSLKREIIISCKWSIGSYLRPANASRITAADIRDRIGNTTSSIIPINTFLLTSDLKQLSPSVVNETFELIGNSEIDKISARIICRKLSNQTSILQLKNLIKGQTADFFRNLSDSELANNLKTIVDNSDSFTTTTLQIIYSKLSKSKLVLLALIRTGDNKLSQLIKTDDIQRNNVTFNDLPLNTDDLPKRIREFACSFKNNNRTLQDYNLTNINEIGNLLDALKPSDLFRLQNNDTNNKLDIIFELSKSNDSVLKSSILRRFLASTVFNYLQTQSSGSVTDIVDQLTDTVLDQINPKIFIEIPIDLLKEIGRTKKILSLLPKVSLFSTDDCSFSREARRNFAKEAYNALGAMSELNTDDLDQLGWLTPNLPIDIIVKINPQAFVDRMQKFFAVPMLQLNASEAAIFSTYLDNIRVSKNISFTDFGSLAIFLKQDAFQNTTDLVKFCKAGYQWYRSDKRKLEEKYRKCRIGLKSEDDSDMQKRAQAFDTLCKNAVKQLTNGNALSGRKKRSINASLSSCDSDQLSLTGQALIDCLSDIGADTNDWTATELTTFANNVKSAYSGIISNIPDSIIIDMNQINLGFSATDLSSLKPTSLESLSTLGKLNTWTKDQINALANNPNIKAAGLLSDSYRLNALANIICGLSSSDINSIPNAVFKDIVEVVGQITVYDCAARSSLYAKAVSVYGSSMWTSSRIQELGTIMSGISTSDFQNNLTPDLMNKMVPDAVGLLPATIYNSLTSQYISSLETDQIDAILQSPQSSSINSSTLTLLNQALDGTSSSAEKSSGTVIVSSDSQNQTPQPSQNRNAAYSLEASMKFMVFSLILILSL